MGNFFDRFPGDDVSIYIVSTYLGMRDLTMLDTAINNHEQRTEFLRLLKEKGAVFYGLGSSCGVSQEEDPFTKFKRYLEWMCRRELKVSTMHYPERFPRDLPLYQESLDFVRLGSNKLIELTMPTLMVNDEDMRKLFKENGEINLKKLSMRSYCLTDETLRLIVHGKPQGLVELNMQGCVSVTDLSLQYIAEGCVHLQVLNISRCFITDVGLKQIANHCPMLKSLNVAFCNRITEAGLLESIPQLKNIQKLDISEYPYDEDVQIVGDVPPIREPQLFEIFKNLKDLTVSGRPITNAVLNSIAEQCPQLQFLDISRCNNINDGGLRSLNTLPRPVVVNVKYCSKITQYGIRYLVFMNIVVI